MSNRFNRILDFRKAPSIGNFVNLSLNQGINVLVALVVTPILFRRLGEAQFGLVTLSLSVVLTLAIFVQYGFNVNAPKRLALILDNPSKQSDLINQIILTRVLVALVCIALLSSGIFFFNFFESYAVILQLSLIVLLGEAFFPLFILQGYDRLTLITISNVGIKVIYLIGILLIIESVQDAKWVNFILGGATLSINVLVLIIIYQKYSLKFRFTPISEIAERLKDNFQFFSYSLATHIMVNGGFLLLFLFVSETELGKYSLAHRVAILLRAVPAFLTQSILQKASRLYEKGSNEFESYLRKATFIGMGLTLIIGIMILVCSPWIISVLAGSNVPYSADILSILGFIPFLAMLNVDNMIRVLVDERKSILSKATWITTFLMLALVLLGSKYYGGYGLAIALLISELCNFLILKLMLIRSERLKTG